ncbi:hypothetical protein MA16_Dca021717 [Dendrobium catenatum]|uniref:Uncharacterized protein n=1 Tax=Dendrobium catenatum TaxID=906689 RepID=A0A2I0WWQ4_9ASPA|nr:hypothetical protein MA16_Dca021717 [Dendrobium catenatum]
MRRSYQGDLVLYRHSRSVNSEKVLCLHLEKCERIKGALPTLGECERMKGSLPTLGGCIRITVLCRTGARDPVPPPKSHVGAASSHESQAWIDLLIDFSWVVRSEGRIEWGALLLRRSSLPVGSGCSPSTPSSVSLGEDSRRRRLNDPSLDTLGRSALSRSLDDFGLHLGSEVLIGASALSRPVPTYTGQQRSNSSFCFFFSSFDDLGSFSDGN